MRRSWVYIVECSDGSYYTGCTTNLEKRIPEHNSGSYGGYTASRRPVKLLWSQEFNDIRYAIEAERTIKKWSRAKKEALMREDFAALKELARSTRTKLKLKNTSDPSTRTVEKNNGTRSG